MSLYLVGSRYRSAGDFYSPTRCRRFWASLAGVEGKEARTVQALYRRSGVKKRHSTLLETSGAPPSRSRTFFIRARFRRRPWPYYAGSNGAVRSGRARLLRGKRPNPPWPIQGCPLPISLTSSRSSCTGFFAPGLDTTLVDLLGLPPTVERTNVGFMGCHGALNGLRVAASFAGADPESPCPPSSVSFAPSICPTYGIRIPWWQTRFSGTGRRPWSGWEKPAIPNPGSWQLVASGTCRLPASADAMSWRIGDHGFRMTLSPSVPDIIERNLKEWMEGWLEESGLSLDEIATWAVHPGGPRILTSASTASVFNRKPTLSRRVFSPNTATCPPPLCSSFWIDFEGRTLPFPVWLWLSVQGS